MTTRQPIWKRAVLIILMLLPLSVYLLSLIISGEVNFRSLEIVGPRQAVKTDAGFDTTYYHVPDFSMTDQYGRTFNRDSLKGKVYVVSFFFTTCPTICPAMNFHLREANQRMAAFKDLEFVSFSIDPDHDTPEVLLEYSKDLGVDQAGNWHFLTGNKDSTFALADEYFLGANTDSTAPGGYYHSQSALIVDWEGRIRSRKDDQGNVQGAYDITTPIELDKMVDDLRVLIKEYRKLKMGHEG